MTEEPLRSQETIHHLRVAVSYYCSLRCQHCYVPELNRVEYHRLLEDQQLTLGQITAFIDRLIGEFRLQKISITGGEAMLNLVWPRTRHVLHHALRRGLEVQLNTSGSGQVTIAQLAEAAGPYADQIRLQVSLDGVDDAKVDRFRGQQGAMQRALRTIRDAVAAGLYVQVRYTATVDNFEDTVRCYELVTGIGVTSFIVKPMFPAGVARNNTAILIRSQDAVRDLQLQLLAKAVGNATRLELPQPVYVDQDEVPEGAQTEFINCLCGGEALYLSTNGDIYPCTYLVGAPNTQTYVLGNIKDPAFDFVRVWRRPSTYVAFRTAERHGNCTAQNITSSTLPVVDAPAQCG
jgi:radical SAM protein with 4Fe4S-binding SPASM domain